MSERIILRTGEALVEGPADYLCAEPEVVIYSVWLDASVADVGLSTPHGCWRQ